MVTAAFGSLEGRPINAEEDGARCRAWRAVLSNSAVDLVFPYWLTPAQRVWFRRTTVAVRGVRFAGPADQLCDPGAIKAVQALAAQRPSIIKALKVHLSCWRSPVALEYPDTRSHNTQVDLSASLFGRLSAYMSESSWVFDTIRAQMRLASTQRPKLYYQLSLRRQVQTSSTFSP